MTHKLKDSMATVIWLRLHRLLTFLTLAVSMQICFAQTASQDYGAAVAARDNGQIESAITYLDSAISKKPSHVPALILLATLKASLKHWGSADKHIEAAIILAPGDTDVLIAQARILSWKTSYTKATYIVSNVLARHPDHLEAWLLKGRIAYYQSQFSTAREAFQTAEKIAPGNLEVLIAIGDIEAAQGHFEEAKASYQKAYGLFPNSLEAAERFRRVFAEKKTWKAGVSVSRSNLERVPLDNWLSVVTHLGKELNEKNNLGVSVEYARRFSLDDVQITTTLDHKFADHISAYVTLAGTPNDEFLPARSAATGANIRWRQSDGKLGSSHLGVDISYRKYIFTNVKGIDLQLKQYFLQNRTTLTVKSIYSKVSGNNDTRGWMGRIDIMPSDRYQIYTGYADAPESDRGIVTSTISSFSGVIFHLTRELDFRIDYARHDRNDSYLRKEFVLGFSLRF